MFQCDRCGICCKKVYKSSLYSYLDRGDGTCRYFDDQSKLCTIYEKRPEICNVDRSYDRFFSDKYSLNEYYQMNYYACGTLKMEDKRMSDIKDALKEKFKSIFGYDCGDDYEPRVRNARSIICQGKYSKDDIIEIWDTSINSNGKSGIVLTVDAVCVKDSANYTHQFIAKYADIDYTHIKEDSFLGMDLSSLNLEMKYGSTYQISLDTVNFNDLMDFIDYAISLYQEEDKLEW